MTRSRPVGATPVDMSAGFARPTRRASRAVSGVADAHRRRLGRFRRSCLPGFRIDQGPQFHELTGGVRSVGKATKSRPPLCYCLLDTVIDDHSRLAFAAALTDETAVTAAAVWQSGATCPMPGAGETAAQAIGV